MTTHRKDAPLYFEGRHWPTIKALREACPAYATTGPLEAIRAGCTTIAEVEAFHVKRMTAAHAANVAQAKAGAHRRFATGSGK